MKNWWKTFFQPITAEVMFKPRLGKQTRIETLQALSAVKNKKNLKVLDLCCGEGRHSVEFAKSPSTAFVTGLDYSKHYLKVAQSKIGKSKKLNFIHGDMKLTSKYFALNSFDLVVSLYNSFGYFDRRSDDFKTLKEVKKVLKPGGRFVINTLNGEGVYQRLGHRKPSRHGIEIEKNFFVLDSAYFDRNKKRTFANWTIIDARKSIDARAKKVQIVRQKFTQNVYTHKELQSLLKRSGFKIIRTWGLLAGETFNEKKSWHQTIVAEKIK